MELFDRIIFGFSVALIPVNLLYGFVGTLLGKIGRAHV